MIESEALALPGIRHGFFTRHGGVSTGIYDSLNVGLGSKDDPANVIQNRARVAAALGVRVHQLVTPHQFHSADVKVVEEPWPHGEGPKADAVVTRLERIAIGVSTADCGPVLFADPAARVVGAAHAGWRGALSGVLDMTVEAMERLGAEADRIVAVVGPTISREAYEVGREFRARFMEEDPDSEPFFDELVEGGKPHFDLPAYIVARLGRIGLSNVTDLGRCTYADEEFFSYRRATHAQEADYGRLISAIALHPLDGRDETRG
ncbi:peptidoglycan editing factor PgeF [Lutibaculum baratangense]|uniref:Purine nucleoside phosphorylase n=1 Tax=Lutibaculum baratangense AMV1 TaxID=631454 RepID=V4T9I9_9HYPH|nr:peptidoglycan editing factor PgeF [Lutibaculum baratangense]ESR23188.1 hypothetical protein N177_3256 [Lutibaculum baratangense AMV1]